MSKIQKSGPTSAPQGLIYNFQRAHIVVGPIEAAGSADSVSVTVGARDRAFAHAAVQSAPDIRPERVGDLKGQVQSGEYHPDPRAVARSILHRGL